VHPIVLALALALSPTFPPQAQPADPCASPRAARAASGVEAFVVQPAARARDTVVLTVVCLRHPADVKVGSYHGELLFDSTSARVIGVEKPQGGMRVENTRMAGSVRFAGANPEGFAQGMLLRVQLRVRKPGKVPSFRLQMRELNSTAGASLLTQLKTSST